MLNNLFFDLEGKDISVGVSGGSDSMALIYMLKSWGKFNKLTALTIDHKLRKESTDEANQVKIWMKDIGLEHHTLTWDKNFNVKTKIQELARKARYELVSKFCLENNIKYFLTAHHANDLIETFFMRFKRGSTIKGLSPINRVTETEFGHIIRPLINTLKKDIPLPKNFINDPSNENEFFERVRIRKILGNEELKYSYAMVKSLNHLSDAKKFIEQETLKAYKTCLNKNLLNKDAFISTDEFIAKEVLKKIIKEIGGSEYFSSPSTIENIFHKLISHNFKGITVGKCFIKKVNKNTISITKEIRKNKKI